MLKINLDDEATQRFYDEKDKFEMWSGSKLTNGDFIDALLDAWKSELPDFVKRTLATSHRIVGTQPFTEEALTGEKEKPGSWSAAARAYHYGVRDILKHLLDQVNGDRRLDHVKAGFRANRKYAGLL